MAKDRARPFSRKHRKYWIPVTGGMILIGLLDVVLGYCSYSRPSDVHERILYDVPSVGSGSAAPPRAATGCAPALLAKLDAQMPGAVVTSCAADRATVVRGPHAIELALAGAEITAVAEVLTLPEIPAPVMRAFAVAYPRTIPSRAVKRTVRGAEPVFELAFPPGAPHALAILRGDGTVVDLR